MALTRIPGHVNLYIGGYADQISLNICANHQHPRLFSIRKEALRNANITHVLSVLCLPLNDDLFVNFQHRVVELDDVEDENILEHFPTSNAFIQEGLDAGGGVLVHWYVGLTLVRFVCFLPGSILYIRLSFSLVMGLDNGSSSIDMAISIYIACVHPLGPPDHCKDPGTICVIDPCSTW